MFFLIIGMKSESEFYTRQMSQLFLDASGEIWYNWQQARSACVKEQKRGETDGK